MSHFPFAHPSIRKEKKRKRKRKIIIRNLKEKKKKRNININLAILPSHDNFHRELYCGSLT